MTRCAGFRFGATTAGIKKSGKPDVGIIVPDAPATCAAIFTQNRVKAAPVLVSQAALAKSRGRVAAVVVNSGNANACTGAQGMADARRMAALAAREVGATRNDVIVSSTGVIGQPLPMGKVEPGIGAAFASLGATFEPFADAILTTDRARKVARKTADGITVLGCTKGAGMIAPNMATTLTFVVTDAVATPAQLRKLLDRGAAETFNAITVDGDTSTNDMILLMASGASGKTPASLEATVAGVLDKLARDLMRGGEGVHHVVTVRVTGARSKDAARQVARSIANSPLAKTAIAGADPNWGRFLSAAGNAGVPLRPDRLALWLGKVQLVRDGVGIVTEAVERRAAAVMQKPEYTLTLDLGAGSGSAQYLACDLSHEYVTINADYRT